VWSDLQRVSAIRLGHTQILDEIAASSRAGAQDREDTLLLRNVKGGALSPGVSDNWPSVA
jgi:hypothetical protein